MKKIFILVLMVLVGFGLFLNSIKADEARTIPHKFIAYTSSTAVTQGKVIYRITGYVTASPGRFGIYDAQTLGNASNDNCAVEGGAATSGNPILPMEFPNGLILNSGSTIVITDCSVVIEYI